MRFWQWNSESLIKHVAAKVTGADVVSPHVVNMKFTGMRGLDTKRGFLRKGNSSGYAAINLAYHLGAKRIFLLGYDMAFENGKSHWHDGYQIENKPDVYNKMISYFYHLVDPLKENGIEVFNACLKVVNGSVKDFSRIECFEKIMIEGIK